MKEEEAEGRGRAVSRLSALNSSRWGKSSITILQAPRRRRRPTPVSGKMPSLLTLRRSYRHTVDKETRVRMNILASHPRCGYATSSLCSYGITSRESPPHEGNSSAAARYLVIGSIIAALTGEYRGTKSAAVILLEGSYTRAPLLRPLPLSLSAKCSFIKNNEGRLPTGSGRNN